MQSLSVAARRFYSTKLPPAARIARTTSTPLAVRLRRRRKLGATPVGVSDSTSEGLTPTELARYKRLKATGKLEEINGKPVTEIKWIDKVNESRSRVRGLKMVERNGIEETEVVGRRVYLPNIIIRLVRNYTLKGQPYNPYEATFRIPKSVTKTDLRSYLLALYGVKTTYIRTDNYISPIHARLRKTSPHKTYKRAVVGLVDPFYYPHRTEDMPEAQKTERETWIEKNFKIQENLALRKFELLRITKGQAKGWNMELPMATKRSHILRLVAARRERREDLIIQEARKWQEMRKRGEHIVLTPSKSSKASSQPE